MSNVINVFAKPAKRKMPTGAKIAIILGAVILALILTTLFALGAIALLFPGVMMLLDIDMMDVAYVLEDFLFFLDGYYA